MSALLPALLLGLAALVLVGLPAPRRFLVRPRARRRHLPDAALGLLVLLALLLPAGPVGAMVGAALAVLGRRAWVARQRTRARREEATAAAEAMAVLAAELRAGQPVPRALSSAASVAVGATSAALAEAGAAAGMGADAGEVLLRQADACASPELLRALSVCWRVCQGAGSSLAAAVDRLEDAVRAERALHDEVQAELAGPRSTALLLAVLPAFGLLLGAGLGAHPLHVLLRTPVGQACLVLGVALDLAGVWWTGRIVRAAEGSS